MKLKKSQLKALIKECLLEVLEEDPRIMRSIIKESMAVMMQQEDRSRRRKPRGTNLPAMKQRSAPQQQEDEPSSLWEALATDTLNTTFRQQPANNGIERGMSWATMDKQSTFEEGPGARLAMQNQMEHQQMMMAGMAQNPQLLHMQQMANIEQMRRATEMAAMQQKQNANLPGQHALSQIPQMAPPPQTVFQNGAEPSPEQLTRQFHQMEQQQPRGPLPLNPSFGGQHNAPLPSVPDDLAMLGIGDMSHHIDRTQQMPTAGGGFQEDMLAAIAADMNDGL